MSLVAANQFIALGRKDKAPFEGLIAEMQGSGSFDKNKIVHAAAQMGYDFTLDEFHSAVVSYMEHNAAELDPTEAALVLKIGTC
jgi:hypothetical protein